MFNTLCMQFGGIVCFAHSADHGVRKVQALLADAREPMAMGMGMGKAHPPHVAALQFYTDQLSPRNQLEPDLRFCRPGSRREQGIVFLVREDLAIEELANDGAPLVTQSRKNNQAPADDVEMRDLFWVADFARLGVTQLKPGCVDTTIPAADGLLARFTLRGGELSTGEVEKSGDTPLLAVFIDPLANTVLPGFNQSLAMWSEWTVPIEPADLTIVLTSFDGAGTQRRLVLSAAGLPIGGSLWASVKNVTMNDLFEVSQIIQPDMEPGVRGSHFDLHYSLAQTMPMPAWIPVSHQVTDGKPLCPPAQLVVGG